MGNGECGILSRQSAASRKQKTDCRTQSTTPNTFRRLFLVFSGVLQMPFEYSPVPTVRCLLLSAYCRLVRGGFVFACQRPWTS